MLAITYLLKYITEFLLKVSSYTHYMTVTQRVYQKNISMSNIF